MAIWANVGLDIGTLGTAQAVSAVTAANPGVLTYVGADPAVGDYFAMFASGMSKLDGRVFRAINVVGGSNTLDIEGENTSTYGVFTAGSMQPITWGQSMATVRSVQSAGGDAKTADNSTIHTDQEVMVKTGVSAHVITLTNKWSVTDPALLDLKTASDGDLYRAVRFRFSDGSKIVGLAKVSAPLIPTGNAGSVIETSVVLYMQGAIKAYAT